MRVILSRRARADLRDIALYIARDNPRRAQTFTAELVATCRGLSQFPFSWALEPDFGPETRRAIHGRYLIFYSVGRNQVVIDHIVHGSSEAWRIADDPSPE